MHLYKSPALFVSKIVLDLEPNVEKNHQGLKCPQMLVQKVVFLSRSGLFLFFVHAC